MDRMRTPATRVKELYGDTLPPAYDDRPSLPRRMIRAARMLTGNVLHDFDSLASQAIGAASLARGERVLVFCCGTGREFPAILEAIGPEGSLVGVDFSATMLSRARQMVQREGWTNVTILEGDVTEFDSRGQAPFDVGMCTLGLSIIPDWERAYGNLLASVRSGGRLVISDLQVATGWRAVLNPLVAWWTRPYGGSRRGHANARALFRRMEQELELLASGTFGHETFRACIARKP
jgi:demethylmenaquinone methyltransferase/2-methoxy-6-polyprenyl-1,4-benzoquinol methylase